MNTSPSADSSGQDRTRAFEALLQPVLESAYRAAFHLARNQEDAEDIVQEAALLAWRNFDRFEQGTNFRAWFHRIATNVFFSRCRAARRRETTVSLEPEWGEEAAPRTHWGSEDDSADAILARVALEDVQDALQALPVEFRVVAVLYFVDDLSYEQIAVAVNRPIGTVRSRLHRARRMLWQRLSGTAQDFGLRAAV